MCAGVWVYSKVTVSATAAGWRTHEKHIPPMFVKKIHARFNKNGENDSNDTVWWAVTMCYNNYNISTDGDKCDTKIKQSFELTAKKIH